MTANAIRLPGLPVGATERSGNICAACGAPAVPGNRFCIACGAALPGAGTHRDQAHAPGARFCGCCGARLRATPAALSGGIAERCRLTVMFCDLVGSTALAARLDPQDLHDLIGAYGRAVAEAVTRHDGFVAHFMGDGVLACFGYPHSDVDDAERAVRAGLTLIDRVARLPAPEPLQIRVGIATGPTIIGALVTEGDLRLRPIVGETPNLAARLQGVARPGTIAISSVTRELIGDAFDCDYVGRLELRGFVEPRRTWLVLGERSASKLEAGQSEKSTPAMRRAS